MTDRDPPRIGDPGSGDSERLSNLLREARADVGNNDEVGALRGLLAASLWPDGTPPGGDSPPGTEGAGSGASGGAATGSAAAGGTALALKAGIGAMIVAAAAGTWFSTRDEPAPKPPTVLSAQASETEPAVSGINSARENDMAAAQPGNVQPSASPDQSGIIEVAPPSSAPVHKKALEAAPTEAALLGQAQAALSRNPSLALTLCEQHRAWHPRGMLVQEREVIAIEALKRLGRTAEASARASRFLKAFPTSAHRSKIESLVPPR